MDVAGREQDLAEPLARLRLARETPAEDLAVDQTGGEQDLADRPRLVALATVGPPP